MPRVSVVMPVFNGARYLNATLDSLFSQTYLDYEVICIEDGSTDDSASLLENYGHGLTVIRQKNAGQSASRNKGVARATGEYVAFLDQDDLWYPSKLQRQMERFAKDVEAVLVHCDYDLVDHEGRMLKKGAGLSERVTALASPLGRLIGEALIFPSAMVVRRDAYLRVGGFCEELRGFEDFDLIARLRQEGSFLMVDAPEMAYRMHEQGFSRAGGIEVIQSREKFLSRMQKLYAGDKMKATLIRHMLADCYSDWGKHEAKMGNRREARQKLLQSIRCHPGRSRTYFRLLRASIPGSFH